MSDDGQDVTETAFPPRTTAVFPVMPTPGLVRLMREDGTEYPPLPTMMEGPLRGAARKALDRIAEAFAAARLSADFEGCPHCYTPADIQYIRDTPLAKFSLDDLREIGSSLVSTLGGPEDVPYFIPRLLEAFAEGLGIDIEPVVDRIAQVPESLWTAERVAAVRVGLETLFEIGHRDDAVTGISSLFGDRETREYVRGKLAALPTFGASETND